MGSSPSSLLTGLSAPLRSAAPSAAMEAMLLALAKRVLRLLEGSGRLRALVFSTGVILLFGGMAAQFAATF